MVIVEPVQPDVTGVNGRPLASISREFERDGGQGCEEGGSGRNGRNTVALLNPPPFCRKPVVIDVNWSSTPSVCLGAISEKDAVALVAEFGIAARGARAGISLEAEREFTTGKTSSGNGWGKFSAERSRIGRWDIVALAD
jgi:hypothetical protein